MTQACCPYLFFRNRRRAGATGRMIRLNCKNCLCVLEIDDAFAGGVCRCEHCGAIQTVPVQPKAKAGAAAPQIVGEHRALHKGAERTREQAPGSGGSAVGASSRNRIILIAAVAAVIILGIIVIVVLVQR